MLAQLNSKQKSIFFNIKPTVIDKLISKNRSSIQKNLLYTNEDSDGSLSGDSEESSSSHEHRVVHHFTNMAPVRRSEKVNVLGSKLSSKSQFPIKKGSGKCSNTQGGRSGNNLKLIAAKKLVENSKKSSPTKIVRDVRSIAKVKTSVVDYQIPGNNKQPRSTVKKLSSTTTSRTSKLTNNNELTKMKLTGSKKKCKDSPKNKKLVHTTENKTQLNPNNSKFDLINPKSSPRKFPSNIVDRWKSTGMVIRGRGRPRGSSRGSVRGGKKRSVLRSEGYNTRDSQTGLMRSGKRRKCSDPNLVEGLEGIKKRRRVINRLKREKNECPSDEYSSFVTTSELSFCDNDNSLKPSDDETVNTRLIKVKVENEDTEDEMMHSKDPNSNLFKSDIKLEKEVEKSRQSLDTNDQSNNSKTTKKNILRTNRLVRSHKSLALLEKSFSHSDSSIRDSDCSLDSDLTEDLTSSPKSAMKRHVRKGGDGLWVRRSTRSIVKNIDKPESDVVIEELLKDKDLIVDLDCNSKCSLYEDGLPNSNSIVQLYNKTNPIQKSSKDSDSVRTMIETHIKENITFHSSTVDSTKPNEKMLPNPDGEDTTPNTGRKPSVNSDISNVENDSVVDFTLSLEESPVKSLIGSTSGIKAENPLKLHFDYFTVEKDSSSSTKECTETTSVLINGQNSEVNPVQKETVVLDHESESLTREFESENLSFPTNLNSDFEFRSVANKKEKNNPSNLTKNTELTILNTANKDDFIDILVNEETDKSSIQLCDNKEEVISDENILTLIDSFCQSGSCDSLIDDGTSCCAINEEDDKKIILDSINDITNEVENKLLKEKNVQELSGTSRNFEECHKISSPNQEISSGINTKELGSEEFEKEINYRTSLGEEYLDKAELLVLNNESNKKETESIDSVKLQNNHSNELGNLHYKTCSTSNMKTEMDLDSTVKTAESTDESSSSESNSNISEVTSTHIENETGNIKLNIPGDEHLNNSENKSDLLHKTNNNSEKAIKESETYSTSHSDCFSSLLNIEPVSTIGDINNDSQVVCTQSKLLKHSHIGENTEERPSKELLSALGLQSLHSVVEDKPKRLTDSYTGTLKAVIKLNRSSDKRSGGRKMIFKQGDKISEGSSGNINRLEYRIYSNEELSTEGVPLTHLADIPNSNRKTQLKVKSQFDLSNSPNIVGAAGSMETAPTDSTKEPGGKQNLIIPEKSSSFSIHPERLCTDVCSYCFGKFGSLDTPCHLAQLKNAERQSKILAIEVHLSADSCLCDGCFRYVDRKANCPTSQRSRKPAARRGPLAGTICAVQECTQPARHSVRRKWLIKLKKSIGKKLVIDMDKNPHLPFPLCSQHYYWVDYFTVCGICKKRLTRNHMYALGPESDELNQALSDDGIPVRLSDKLFLCKLCRYYSSLRLKYRDPAAMSSTHRLFLNSYRKKILHYHDIPISDSEEEGKSLEEEGGTSEVSKSKKKKSKSKSLDGHESKKRIVDKGEKSDPGNEDRSNDSQMIDYSYLDALNVHREEHTTPTVDYGALEDFGGQVGFSNIASLLNPLEGAQGTVYPSDSQNRSRVEKPTRIQVKFGNLNIGKLSNLNIGQDTRATNNATPTSERPPYLPGERELKLSSEFEFHGTLNPSSGWERCTSTIQFDRDTKRLWQDLQRPYGNQSSFLRHLLILEKHWRNGSLVLSENPNPRAVKYIGSVRNRVQAYDEAKSSDIPEEKPKKIEVNLTSPPPRPVSTPIKTTSAPPPLMKITPGSTPWLHDQIRRPPVYKIPTTSTQTTNSRLVPVAPPPYRFPHSRPNQFGLHTGRMPTSSSVCAQTGRGQQTIRPVSISYQQFKKIRLEHPPASVSQVTIVPKVERTVEIQTTSTSSSSGTDFVPLISDVRSLATSTSDWNESFRKQQQKMLKQSRKYYTPILPKIPNSLTVTTFPQTTALVMKTSSLTIEKAPNICTKPNFPPPEKPSISVFRETTPSDNG